VIYFCTGFGHTVDSIDVSRAKMISKTLFSMLTNEVKEELNNNPTRKSVVLFGIMVRLCVCVSACMRVCVCVCVRVR